MIRKKGLASLLACSILFAAAPVEAMAYETPELVRVGLESVCKNVSTATIGVWDLYIGMEWDHEFEEGGKVTSSGTFTAKPASGEVVMIESEMYLDEAIELAENLTNMGYDAYAAYLMDQEWTVAVKGASRTEVEDASMQNASKKSFEGFAVTGGEVNLLLHENTLLMGGNVGDTFKLNGKPYRGMLTFSVTGNTMTAVNVIGLEEYLYGVVPSEMPKSYHEEALKA